MVTPDPRTVAKLAKIDRLESRLRLLWNQSARALATRNGPGFTPAERAILVARFDAIEDEIDLVAKQIDSLKFGR